MAFEQRSLDDYIDVAQCIADFREEYSEGTLRPLNPAEPYKIVQAEGFEKDGSVIQQTFIVVVAAAYRWANDTAPGVGMAWEIFPGRTPYTRGSELQNAETSAWGRAIIAVGASDSKRGIASREEVRNRQAERSDVQCPFCKDTYVDMDAHMIADLKGCGSKYRAMPLSDRELIFLLRNANGSLSRSRTSDEEKAAGGVMTDAEQRAHNKLVKDVFNAVAGKVERIGSVDAVVDDRWTTDAPSWLVGVDPPEDQPGTISEAQSKQMHAVYTALKITDRAKRLADATSVLVNAGLLPNGSPVLKSSSELSFKQAARLLENLHDRHSGKMTRR